MRLEEMTFTNAIAGSQPVLEKLSPPSPIHEINPSTVRLRGVDNFTLTANPVPEPAAAGLTVLALGGLALRRRR